MKLHDAVQHFELTAKHGLFFEESCRMMAELFVAQEQLVQAADLSVGSVAQHNCDKQLTQFRRELGFLKWLCHYLILFVQASRSPQIPGNLSVDASRQDNPNAMIQALHSINAPARFFRNLFHGLLLCIPNAQKLAAALRQLFNALPQRVAAERKLRRSLNRRV